MRIYNDRRMMRFLIYCIVAFVAFYFLATKVSYRNVLDALYGSDVTLLILAWLCAICHRSFNAFQLAMYLAIAKTPTSVAKLFKLNLVITFYSAFLPGTLTSSAWSLYRYGKVVLDVGLAGAVLVYIKLINLAALITAVGITVLIQAPPISLSPVTLLFCSALALVSVGVLTSRSMSIPIRELFRSAAETRLFKDLTEKTSSKGIYKITEETILSFNHSISLFIDAGVHHKCGVFFLGALIVVTRSCAIYCVVTAVGGDVSLGISILTLAVLSLLQLIPVSFLGLGLRELGMVGLLPYYGVSETVALTAAIVLFLIGLSEAILGAILEGLNVLRIRL